jgi:hypothetical protein
VDGSGQQHLKSSPPLPPGALQVEKLRKDVQHEAWYVFYARYELAMLWYRRDGQATHRVLSKLGKVRRRGADKARFMKHHAPLTPGSVIGHQ